MKKTWLVAGVAACVLGGAGAAWMAGVLPVAAMAKAIGSSKKDEKPAVALEFTAREVAQPQRTRLAERLEFSGPLVAPQTAVLRAKASGTLLSLTVAEGGRVGAGQVVGRVDLAEQASRVAERSASVESARATLVQAERTHASNERLAAQAFISPIALDTSRSQVDTARAALAAAQASLSTTQVGLREAVPTAPLSGIVAKRHVLPGEKVAIEQPLLTIVDLRVLELAGTVGTHEVASLSPGMPVQVKVEGVAKPVAGRIARIAPAAEPGTRSIGVTVELANPDERLRAGQYAVAQASLPDDKQRLALPLTAIGSTAGQSHVWVIEQGKLARRAVTTGRVDEAQARVEVVSGLGADAQVLAARFDNLREGAAAVVTAVRASAPAATVQR